MKRDVSGFVGEPSAQAGEPAPTGASALAAAALREAARLVAELTPEQLAELDAGRARFVYQETAAPTTVTTTAPSPLGPARRVPTPPTTTPDADVVGPAVRAIRDLHTPGEVADHLSRNRYPVPVLKQIARALGPTVSTAARNRTDLERNIVEGTAGYRTRSAAMSGGAWS